MAVNAFKIKKWVNMLRGKSVYHVKQDAGKIYSKDSLEGYYNNFTEKITLFGLNDDSVPMTRIDTGEEIFFSISIFQYGLGAYDLYLLNRDSQMRDKFLSCAKWAVDNQENNGAWKTFFFEDPSCPYSAMAQGEAISLLLRAYRETNDNEYFISAKKAKDFMLKPIEVGGTTKYDKDCVYLYEYTYSALVLNGWIFAAWGLWDYYLATNDKETYDVYFRTVKTIKKSLKEFDNGFWSKYDIDKRIASPFYHDLHIAQLQVMYELTGENIFYEYSEKWKKYNNSFWNPKRAFLIKALQKILE